MRYQRHVDGVQPLQLSATQDFTLPNRIEPLELDPVKQSVRLWSHRVILLWPLHSDTGAVTIAIRIRVRA